MGRVGANPGVQGASDQSAPPSHMLHKFCLSRFINEPLLASGSAAGQATDTESGDPASLHALKCYRTTAPSVTRAIDAEAAERRLSMKSL